MVGDCCRQKTKSRRIMSRTKRNSIINSGGTPGRGESKDKGNKRKTREKKIKTLRKKAKARKAARAIKRERKDAFEIVPPFATAVNKATTSTRGIGDGWRIN